MAGLTIKPLGALAQGLAVLYQAPPDKIRGVDNATWFGPLQPFRPIAPAGTEPRRFNYIPGQNLDYTPRSQEPYTSDQLRAASRYPLARILIENVKDAVSRLPVNIRLKRMPGESGKEYAKRKPDPGILKALGDLIENPNPDQNRQEFSRQLVEDMLVIDAASILLRTTKQNKLAELRAIDGATIARYVDENGYTPAPPYPAYAQLYQGIPMVDLNTRQLLYAARNVLPHKLYGFSPTEQALVWIDIGSQRLQFKLNAYTEGSIPDGIQVIPPGVNPDKIAESQAWMVSDLAGNLAKRRQIRLIQGFAEAGKEQIIFPKELMLADSYDDLEINCFCFAYGVSKQRLQKMMNRASAQADQEAAEKEGLEPWLDWMSNSVWNKIIQVYLGIGGYEAVYDDDTATDPLKDAQIHNLRVRAGRESVNEWRESDGDEPRSDVPEADQLLVYTATGIEPLGVDQSIERTQTQISAGVKADPTAPKGPIAGAPAPAAGGKPSAKPSAKPSGKVHGKKKVY